MPRHRQQWDEITRQGNPTKSAAAQQVIKDLKKREVRGAAVPSQARRSIDWDEFMRLLVGTCLVFPLHDAQYIMLAVLMLQWQIIGRIDDVMQLATTTIQSNSMYPFTLQVKMCWSNNIVNENQLPTQFLFASMDPLVCPLLNLVVYFKHIHEEATSEGILFPEHRNRGISIFLSNIFESEHFPSSNKIGKLGTHSICKGTATYASCNGLIKDWISKHGRWRGQAQMVDTYIDTYQVCFFLFASLTRQLIY